MSYTLLYKSSFSVITVYKSRIVLFIWCDFFHSKIISGNSCKSSDISLISYSNDCIMLSGIYIIESFLHRRLNIHLVFRFFLFLLQNCILKCLNFNNLCFYFFDLLNQVWNFFLKCTCLFSFNWCSQFGDYIGM